MEIALDLLLGDFMAVAGRHVRFLWLCAFGKTFAFYGRVGSNILGPGGNNSHFYDWFFADME